MTFWLLLPATISSVTTPLESRAATIEPHPVPVAPEGSVPAEDRG